jgi:Uma2 family endonuclease
MSIAELPPTVGDAPARDDEPLFEVINGQIVEMPPMSFHSTKIGSRIVRKVGGHANDNNLGEVVAETLFRLPLEEDAHRNRRPDAAFVSYERWPRDKPESIRDNAWDVVPDLVIEVVSPSDSAAELIDKIGEYFEAGVRLVWVVYPRPGLVYIHESVEKARVVGRSGVLDGGDVLPGLQLPLNELFVFPLIEEENAGDK